ncbi:hypothetical protein SEA_OBLADI_112 [Gordonia phage ObLaDi]|uniref:Uncharacterized protein n=4 Tax=Cafassovirus TaxID=3425056 RepID=A0A9E7QCL5_9CAUD|nr:hypothetical protein SEA_CAFASSO_113 [Gordonia phage Cafasso]UVK59851.1 hypothetical protein SEA_ALEEMILY_111 [Gordonia phage Aleemily]UXE03835.1 hypothetical protein SEA_OBLADI_112 [Gordonia phage ObLaDi]
MRYRYEVLVYTNEHPDPDLAWVEVLVWSGDSLVQALREWNRERRRPRGAYVTLRAN